MKCDRLIYSCSACVKLEVPCRYPSWPSSSILVNGEPMNHDSRRRKPRGPYKTRKSPREKVLEYMERTMRGRCRDLEGFIQNTAFLDSYKCAPAANTSEAFCVSPTSYDRTVRHNSTSVGAKVTLGGDTQHHETSSSYSGELLLSSLPSDVSQLVEGPPVGDAFCTEHLRKIGPAENLPHPPYKHIFELWHIFLIRVDPITKLVHCPSFSEHLIQAIRSPEMVKSSMHALIFSICFASVNALSEYEVTDRFNESKMALLARYTHGMQSTPAYLDALHQPCLGILQALVLHTLCLHRHDNTDQEVFSKSFILALQVARLMGLDEDDSTGRSPLETEIRRRCWWTLYWMRRHCAQEHGSIVDEAEFAAVVSLPLNINDIDLGPMADDTPTARTGITDMSFFLFTVELIKLHAKAQNLVSTSASWSVNQSEREGVQECVKRLESNFLRHCDASRPFDWFLLLTGKAMLTPIEIILLENLEATRHMVEATDDHLHESKRDAKFSLRLDIVECWHMLKTNEKLKTWTWFSWTFQPAVTIGDICTELARYPLSAHSKRAHALIELISLG